VASLGGVCTTAVVEIPPKIWVVASKGSSTASFSATVSAITDAFGDPTRRRVYLFARDTADATGVTTSEVAAEVGVHPNVARHHLEKLAAGGYLEVHSGRGGSGAAGRPSKRYIAVDDVVTEFPVRSDDLVLSLLGRALTKLPRDEAETLAEEVGAEYGRAMAEGLTGETIDRGQKSLRAAMRSVADALTAHGFAAHADNRSNQLRIINDHCPFGDIATEHPVICAVDRGMVRGMLAVLYGENIGQVTTEASLAFGDTFCSTTI
jgi:predicted ArsR family transcriptional regulator